MEGNLWNYANATLLTIFLRSHGELRLSLLSKMKYQFTFRRLILARKQNPTILFQNENFPPSGITLQKIHFGKAKRLPIPNVNVTKTIHRAQ